MLPQQIRRWLLILFTSLWISDTILTILFVTACGVESEGNPVMRWAIMTWGLTGFTIIKAATLAFWLLVQRHAPIIIHGFLLAIMTYVVYLGVLMVLGV